MRKFTYEQLSNLEWCCTHIEDVDHELNLDETYEFGVFNRLVTTGTLSSENNSFTFVIYGEGKTTCYKDAFEFDLSIEQEISDCYNSDNFVLVDDEGDELDCYEFRDFCIEAVEKSDWVEIMMQKLPEKEINYIDQFSTKEYEFELEISDSPSFAFNGICLASSSSDNGYESLRLFQAESGKYICYKVMFPYGYLVDDCHTIRKGQVCENIQEIFEFFGGDYLAKDIYRQMGFKYTVEI